MTSNSITIFEIVTDFMLFMLYLVNVDGLLSTEQKL